MASLGRWYWILTSVLAYTCFGAARSGGGVLPWLALLVLPVGLSEVFRRTQGNTGDDRLSAEARSAVRATAWGAALLIAARTGAAARPALDAAANLGAGTAAVGALVALARLPPTGGLLQAPGGARSLDAALFTGFLWSIATAVPGAHALLPAPSLRFDPLLIDTATTSAGIGSLLVLVAATLRLRWMRRLELGIGDRARSAFALCIAGFTVAVPAAWLDVASPDRVLPAAVASVALACAWAASTPEATSVTRVLRGLLAVTLLGAPLVVGATAIAQLAPSYAPALVLSCGVLAIGVGLVANALARPLGPEQSRWLMALDRAARDALQPEPATALRAALVALGETASDVESRPEIWQREPPEVLSVDVAGYLHIARSEAPASLYEFALSEPERTLRTEALRALQVRRPELRGLLAWLEARGAFSATLIVDDEGALGFILLPHGTRNTPMTLEEARAARLLADRVSSLLAVAAALARARQRELLAVDRADKTDDECKRLEHIVLSEEGRHRAHAERLARNARTAAYSPAARAAIAGLERIARESPLLALSVPPGSDPVGWAAHYHLASARSGGALVVVDGAVAEEQALERWESEERSPLRLADGGSLLLLNTVALPLPTQEMVALALSRRAAHAPRSSVLPPGVVIALPLSLEVCVQRGLLSATLSRWFAAHQLELPPLSQRAEDLRALALDALARRCLELGRPPLGLEPAALRLILEHSWPENELALTSVLGRAAALARAPTVTDGDLMAAGLHPEEGLDADVIAASAPAARRRPSRRPARGS